MVLHEYYFDNLKSGGGTGDPAKGSQFVKAAETRFGSYDIWKTDFVGIGKMRGVGWAICYQNPANGRLSNHWITLHETGNVAGLTPILVMDVWEHAYFSITSPRNDRNTSRRSSQTLRGTRLKNGLRKLPKRIPHGVENQPRITRIGKSAILYPCYLWLSYFCGRGGLVTLQSTETISGSSTDIPAAPEVLGG